MVWGLEVVMLTGKWIDGKDNLKDAFKVRFEVFVNEQKVNSDIEIDEFDKTSKHFVFYDGKTPVGTGRVVKNNDQYSIGRICVLKEYRGQKIGDLIVRMLIEKTFELGATNITIQAQTYVEKFYENFGFISFGYVFDEADIDNISMKLTEEEYRNSISGCNGCNG